MSAVWIKLATILCLSCTVLSAAEKSGVVWRDFGGEVTIQCRYSQLDQECLELRKGLNEETQVLHQDSNADKKTIANEFTGRLQPNGKFPNVDIFIKNLTLEDTGPYWCLYKKFDQTSNQEITTKGTGSVLLVVKATAAFDSSLLLSTTRGKGDTHRNCDSSKDNLVFVSVVISAAVLLSIIMAVLIWLIKTKTANPKIKPRRVPSNDVYEDMRGTLRR